MRKGLIVAAGIGAALMGFAAAMPATAIGLCGCCGDDRACASDCATAIVMPPNQCPAFVVYDGPGNTPHGANPLNGFSLKDLSIGRPSAPQLESLRRFLEKHRLTAVKAYVKADRKRRHGKLSREAFDMASALYSEALVNYQHGIRAYLNAIGRKSD